MALLDKIARDWRVARDLPKFFREPITLEWSHQTIRQRLRNRGENLLAIVKRTIYENEASPYLKLLKLAGCEYGDFEQMVHHDGVEATLSKLRGKGVYISCEEFKGEKEVIRGGKTFRFRESDFDNPLIKGHLECRSGATRSSGTRTVYDFDYLTESRAAYRLTLFDAYDALDFPLAMWAPIAPGHGLISLLSYTQVGKTPVKWFSMINRKGFKPSFENRIATNYVVYIGRILGAKLPIPEYVALADAWIIARWMANTIKEHGGCCLHAYPSSAVRICQVAKKEGIDIAGAKFFVGGEPLTEVKRREIALVGASVCPKYAYTELGSVGMGCSKSVASDDVHLLKDTIALIQHQRQVTLAGVSVDAFLFTSLVKSSPKVLLNVENGDYGVVETRNCGCKLEKLGFTDHIYNIRGFDKLTGEGMTFVGTDLVRIIEEVLPAKFGGASTNYQIVEEEDKQGHTKISLLISPELGDINTDEVIRTIIAELGKGEDNQRMMAHLWSQAETIRAKRISPISTARGKLLPLHIQKKK